MFVARERINRAPRGNDTSILNVGVGARFFVSRQLDADVLTDVDFPMERLPNFVLCDAQALPFRDNSFNLAYCHNVLEHVANPWQVIRELRRVAEHSNIRQDVWWSLVSYATPEHLWLQLPNLKFLQYKRTRVGILFSKMLRYVLVNLFANTLHFSAWINIMSRRYEVIL
jgi:SAM-dependent methyltransferase